MEKSEDAFTPFHNDILEEYQEIIEQKTSPIVAQNVINLLLKSENVELITPHFNFRLVEEDHDDEDHDYLWSSNDTEEMDFEDE